jgi:hypothetical protein
MSRLPSERVIVNSGMSFAGSAQRSWRLTRIARPWALPATVLAALALTGIWWALIFVWYVVILTVGLWLIALPYRILRRGARKRKIAARQHAELLSAIEKNQSAK